MKIEKSFISKESSIFKTDGWFITVDNNTTFPIQTAKKLNIQYDEYKQIAKSCNAKIILYNKLEHFIFLTEDDIDIAITMLTIIINK